MEMDIKFKVEEQPVRSPVTYVKSAIQTEWKLIGMLAHIHTTLKVWKKQPSDTAVNNTIKLVLVCIQMGVEYKEAVLNKATERIDVPLPPAMVPVVSLGPLKNRHRKKK